MRTYIRTLAATPAVHFTGHFSLFTSTFASLLYSSRCFGASETRLLMATCYLSSDSGYLSAVCCQHMPEEQKKCVETEGSWFKRKICGEFAHSLCLLCCSEKDDSSLGLISTAGKMITWFTFWYDGENICKIVFNLLNR